MGGKLTSEMGNVSVEVATGDSLQSDIELLIMEKAIVKPQITTDSQKKRANPLALEM